MLKEAIVENIIPVPHRNDFSEPITIPPIEDQKTTRNIELANLTNSGFEYVQSFKRVNRLISIIIHKIKRTMKYFRVLIILIYL
jgi:hypothetical protein